MLRAFYATVFQRQHTLRRSTLEEVMSGQAAQRHATAEDVARMLGHLDATVMVPIMELRPTIADIEEASMWLGGDRDVFEPGPPLKGVASRIVTILTANEQEESPREG
jgi:phosphoenolpyruvate carboxylase